MILFLYNLSSKIPVESLYPLILNPQIMNFFEKFLRLLPGHEKRQLKKTLRGLFDGPKPPKAISINPGSRFSISPGDILAFVYINTDPRYDAKDKSYRLTGFYL